MNRRDADEGAVSPEKKSYAAARSVVELDGESHSEHAASDAQRDAILPSAGYAVLRLTNEQVFSGLTAVLEAIEAHYALFRPV